MLLSGHWFYISARGLEYDSQWFQSKGCMKNPKLCGKESGIMQSIKNGYFKPSSNLILSKAVRFMTGSI